MLGKRGCKTISSLSTFHNRSIYLLTGLLAVSSSAQYPLRQRSNCTYRIALQENFAIFCVCLDQDGDTVTKFHGSRIVSLLPPRLILTHDSHPLPCHIAVGYILLPRLRHLLCASSLGRPSNVLSFSGTAELEQVNDST
jgi:hypothetical protein